ncbi:DUF3710 domain-containing protein [Schaalia sp. ZJ405]|uniref:DUF3710 domain-containing protein n=1 Tax=unclassified Schaalia TaxID=2691889 RepID=UPI0013EC3AA0|nr:MULTISPECIES: DUF3710 domain-containing protein [unclassified Schaalia]QPK81979.1 DUF3710 domain-containing protein [Schaalia sp. ZJ405]
MFGRKKKHEAVDAVEEKEESRLPRMGDDDPIWGTPGPRSAHEVDLSEGYIDLGSILIPTVKGMQLRTQVADDKKTVLRILIVLGVSGIQMSVAAAPRSGGVWDEVREEIRSQLTTDGAKVEDLTTRYGAELLADVPVEMPDGRAATSRMRIIGREGPRWFARIDIIGPAADDDEAGAEIEKVIDRIVVRRDDQPRARLDLLPLHLPAGATQTPDL